MHVAALVADWHVDAFAVQAAGETQVLDGMPAPDHHRVTGHAVQAPADVSAYPDAHEDALLEEAQVAAFAVHTLPPHAFAATAFVV